MNVQEVDATGTNKVYMFFNQSVLPDVQHSCALAEKVRLNNLTRHEQIVQIDSALKIMSSVKPISLNVIIIGSYLDVYV